MDMEFLDIHQYLQNNMLAFSFEYNYVLLKHILICEVIALCVCVCVLCVCVCVCVWVVCMCGVCVCVCMCVCVWFVTDYLSNFSIQVYVIIF